MSTRAVRKSSRYDVVVMLSGGKDSAWLLHHIRRSYTALRVLAVLVDNGFLAAPARRNAARVARLTETDFATIVAPSAFLEPLRDAFIRATTRGSYGTVDFTDGELTHAIGADITKAVGAAYTISGLAWAQVERIFGVKDIVIPDRSPPLVCPFWAWKLSEDQILNDVVSLGLLSRSAVSPIKTNQTLISLMGVVDVQHLGYSSWEPEFCEMIRNGKSSLSRWLSIFELLEYCGRTGWLVRHEAKRLADQLDLDLSRDLRVSWGQP